MGYDIPENFGLVVVDIQNTAVGFNDSCRWGVEYVDVTTMAESDFQRIANVFRDQLKPIWDSGWQLGPVRQYYRKSGDLFLSEDTTLESGTGGSATYSAPQVAIIMKKSTGLIGRKFRGRCYLPGVSEGGVDEAGNVDPSAVTGLNAAFLSFLGAVNADVDIQQMMLLHSEAASHVPTVITSLSCATKVGTIRRRLRR